MLITALLWVKAVFGKANLETILSLPGNSQRVKARVNFISKEVAVPFDKKERVCGSPNPLVFQGKKYKPTRKNQEPEQQQLR